MIDIDGIRKRAENAKHATDIDDVMDAIPDRDELLAYVDELRAAAGKVLYSCKCGRLGWELSRKWQCPSCADLRALLTPPADPRPAPARE